MSSPTSKPTSPTTDKLPETPVAIEDEMDEEAAVKVNLTSSDPTKIKFISANSEYTKKTGDAKVDIENVQRSVGMGKDELMKYANDPFWVRLRMTLFVLFWIVWVAMLVGSVVIIFLAPRCAPPPRLDWWQKTVVYQVLVGSFKDSNGDGAGDLQGLMSKIPYLQENQVNTLLLGPIFEGADPYYGYQITSFTNISQKFGTMEDFTNLIETAHANEIKILLEFIPNHTGRNHTWFTKSAKSEGPYTDYYIWAGGEKGPDMPPNNWLGKHGGPAWTYDNQRKQFFLNQVYPDQPDLNFTNHHVKEEIKNVLQFWLDKGVDGFKINHMDLLVEAESLEDEPRSINSAAEYNQYDYLNHTYTANHPLNLLVLKEWRELLDNYTLGANHTHKRVLLTDGAEPTVDDTASYYGNHSHPLSDVPFYEGLTDIKSKFEALNLSSAINSWINAVPEGLWPNWVLGTFEKNRLATRLGPSKLDAIHTVALLAKGTPIVYYGDEIGMKNVDIRYPKDTVAELYNLESRDPMRTPMQWDNSSHAGFSISATTLLPVATDYATYNVEAEKIVPHSHLNVFQRLITIRGQPAIQFGSIVAKVLPDTDNVFVMLRVLKGNPGYLVAVNFNEEEITVDLTKASDVLPENAKVELATNSQAGKGRSDIGIPKQLLKSVDIGGRQAVVLSFVPKQD